MIPACPPLTTFDQYQNLGSCAVGNVVFSDFAFNAASGTMRSPSDTSIQPVVNQGLYSQIDLDALSAMDGSSQTQQVTIGFLESAANGFAITGLDFEFNGMGSHNGVASITEDYCVGHIIVGCPTGLGGEVALNSSSSPFSNSLSLPGVPSVYVAYTLTATSGVLGSAEVVQFENSTKTTPTPEPNALPIAASLAAILLVARRKFLQKC